MKKYNKLYESINQNTELYKYVSSIRNMMPSPQKEYYDDLLENLKEVKCVSIHDIFTEDEIRKISRRCNIESKGCYKNAFKVAELFQDKDIKYCEGFYGFNNFFIDHAFNKIGNKYFDITMELLHNDNVSEHFYATYGEFSIYDCYNVQSRIGVWGEVNETLWKDKNNIQYNRYLRQHI